MKTHIVTLKDFSPEEFEEVKRLVNIYPYRAVEPQTTHLQFIKRALGKANTEGSIQFRLTKEEFSFLVEVIDIMSIGAWEWNQTFDTVHSFYKRLSHKFIQMFKEDAYASADIGASTPETE